MQTNRQHAAEDVRSSFWTTTLFFLCMFHSVTLKPPEVYEPKHLSGAGHVCPSQQPDGAITRCQTASAWCCCTGRHSLATAPADAGCLRRALRRLWFAASSSNASSARPLTGASWACEDLRVFERHCCLWCDGHST